MRTTTTFSSVVQGENYQNNKVQLFDKFSRTHIISLYACLGAPLTPMGVVYLVGELLFALKAIFVRDGSVVALQPTFAFLPVMTSLFESCRPNSLDEGKSNESYDGIELLSPRLNPAEAFLVLDHRRKRELSPETYSDRP